MNTILHQFRNGFISLLVVGLAACQLTPVRETSNLDSIDSALQQSIVNSESLSAITNLSGVADMFLPPVDMSRDEIVAQVEHHFDVSVNGASANEFFMSLVKGTAVNMIVHPDVSGSISISLNDVTLEDVLANIKDVYGYQYRRNGNTYQVFPARIRTQIFKIDYLHIKRTGSSRTRVSSGASQNPASSSGSGSSRGSSRSNSGTRNQTSTRPGGTSDTSGYISGSLVNTSSESDFWKELQASLKVIVGDAEGSKVMVHPQTGVIVVHAMPDKLRDVGELIKAIEDASHRLVVLEAKIIEVQLNDQFQSGINWAGLIKMANDKSILLGHSGGGTVFDQGTTSLAGTVVPLVKGVQSLGFPTKALGGMFTIDANLGDFNALIELLKIQGDVQVLSSPRITTINNQKAVIKVGQDEYFVTDLSTNTNAINAGINQTVDVTVAPFFSGVALDVIPQISDDGSVILYIHPMVSEVRESVKDLTISSTQTVAVPFALSTIRESDTVVRATSGQVIIIGGLMKDVSRDQESRTPLAGDLPLIGHMFRHKRVVTSKSELVILLRPVVINSGEQWNNELRDTARRFQSMRDQ